MSDKVFNSTIVYLKIVTGFGAVFCLLPLFFMGFDPWHSLDKMIWMDLYKSPELPDAAKPAFTFTFLLFNWLSVLTMILIFLITKYSLAKREQWAFGSLILIGFFWPLGGAVVTYYTSAWSYFFSVGIMSILFIPPIILLYSHFRNNSK